MELQGSEGDEGRKEDSGGAEEEGGSLCLHQAQAPSVFPAPDCSSCGGEPDCSGSSHRASGAWSVRGAGARRAQRETEGQERCVFLERARVEEARAERVREHRARRRHEDLLAAQRLGAGLLPVPLLAAR